MGAKQFLQSLNPFKKNVVGDEVTKGLPQVVTPLGGSTMRIFGINNEEICVNYSEGANVVEALQKCPPVSYILYKKSLAFIQGKLEVTNLKDNSPVDLTKFKHAKLLQTPNVLQSDVQFRIHVKMMIEAFGYCPVLLIRPETMRSEISSMWVLQPNLCTFTRSGKLHRQVKYSELWDKMTFTVFGESVPLNKEDVYVFTDITPYFSSQLIPESRLNSCSQAISAIVSNYEARVELLKNRGPLGILRSDATNIQAVPFMEGGDERENLQKDFTRYGLGPRQRKVIMTGAALKWEPMGYNINELMLTEQEVHDIKTVSAALSYPFELLPHAANSTYENQKQRKIELFEDAIIPEALNYCQQLNDMLETAKLGIYINYTYSHISALQPDKRLAAMTNRVVSQTAIEQYQANAITFNQMLVDLGKPEVANGNYYYRDSPEYKLIVEQNQKQNGTT